MANNRTTGLSNSDSRFYHSAYFDVFVNTRRGGGDIPWDTSPKSTKKTFVTTPEKGVSTTLRNSTGMMGRENTAKKLFQHRYGMRIKQQGGHFTAKVKSHSMSDLSKVQSPTDNIVDALDTLDFGRIISNLKKLKPVAPKKTDSKSRRSRYTEKYANYIKTFEYLASELGLSIWKLLKNDRNSGPEYMKALGALLLGQDLKSIDIDALKKALAFIQDEIKSKKKEWDALLKNDLSRFEAASLEYNNVEPLAVVAHQIAMRFKMLLLSLKKEEHRKAVSSFFEEPSLLALPFTEKEAVEVLDAIEGYKQWKSKEKAWFGALWGGQQKEFLSSIQPCMLGIYENHIFCGHYDGVAKRIIDCVKAHFFHPDLDSKKVLNAIYKKGKQMMPQLIFSKINNDLEFLLQFIPKSTFLNSKEDGFYNLVELGTFKDQNYAEWILGNYNELLETYKKGLKKEALQKNKIVSIALEHIAKHQQCPLDLFKRCVSQLDEINVLYPLMNIIDSLDSDKTYQFKDKATWLKEQEWYPEDQKGSTAFYKKKFQEEQKYNKHYNLLQY